MVALRRKLVGNNGRLGGGNCKAERGNSHIEASRE
jgi:hypothetical protein